MADNTLLLAVLQAQQGDTRAFDTLVRQFQNSAVAYARTLVCDPGMAEDAAQEAFVQAWRDLPRLHEAAAFGSWLRRIVFKFADRQRRVSRLTVPLEDALSLPGTSEPAALLEKADERDRLHAAVESLPAALREATLLFYFTGQNIKEIAAFLETPPSTVKNRLFAARKRLRKELWAMAEMILEEEKPSRSETFADNVLARVLREFQQQEATDPQTANRGLLDEGRAALLDTLAQETALETQTIHNGFILLWRKRDWTSLAALLMRVLAAPASDSEAAWAYIHLANALAMSGSPAGAVLAQEAFESWRSGKAPCLSADWPFYPADAATSESVYAGADVRLLFLSQSAEFTTSYREIFRGQDYLRKVDAALAEIPTTPGNHRQRFFVLRMATNACEVGQNWDAAERYIQQMHSLADAAQEGTLNIELHAKGLGHAIHLAQLKQDETAFLARVQELTDLLKNAEHTDPVPFWLPGERHNLAHQLVYAGLYEQALPLWDANAAAGGQLGGWGWLLYAATVWQLTHDRSRVLELLRQARAHDDRDMTLLFEERAEFTAVWEDTEFRQAVRQP